jgi:hypothetical protein
MNEEPPVSEALPGKNAIQAHSELAVTYPEKNSNQNEPPGGEIKNIRGIELSD